MDMATYNLLDFPKTVAIQTIDFCAHNCSFCPLPDLRKKGFITKNLMKISLFKKIIREIAANESKVKRVNLYALNDPLEDERIVDLIKMARNGLPFTKIGLSTTGILNFSPEKYLSLKKAGLNSLFISIPSLDRKSYKKLMRIDALQKVLNKIDDCLNKEKKESIIRIGSPVTKYFDLRTFKDYFEKERNLPVDVWLIENRANLNKNYDSQIPKKVSKSLLEHGLKWKRCDRPIDMANIMYDGRIVLCCADWEKKMVFGNVLNDSIENIWKSSKTRKIQKYISLGEYEKIPLCKDCSENPKNNPFSEKL